MRRRLGLGNEPIVLTVSAKRPHKNLDRLFEAFLGIANDRRLRSSCRVTRPSMSPRYESEPRLWVPAGGSGSRAGSRTISSTRSIARPRVSSSPLSRRGSAFPCSRRSPAARRLPARTPHRLPEVAGDAVLYFDPLDVGEMTRAIERLLTDEALREQLRRAGPERARIFTWDRTAQATLASYDRALRG